MFDTDKLRNELYFTYALCLYIYPSVFGVHQPLSGTSDHLKFEFLWP
jgi:hypothetical protein